MYEDKPSIDELMHYGMPRRSGRYPYGSGKDPYQHSGDFLSRVAELKKQGMSESDIAKSMGILNDKGNPSSTNLRTQISLAKAEQRALEVDTAKGLREKGYSLNQIADKMGYKNDSSVRSLLNENSEIRMNQAMATAEHLKKIVAEKGMVDVGAYVERELNISKEKKDQALYILQLEGYEVYGGRVPQPTNKGQLTTLKVLCPPGTEHKAIFDFEEIHSVGDYISRDDGKTFEKKFNYPSSMDSKRLAIRYKEDGGIDKDGVIELRRNVDDLSLGESRYAQVRILVDKTHYIKGMAVYSDDLPPGVDIMFNTNKSKSTPKMDVLKKIGKDPDNPFGSAIKDADQGGQYWYKDAKGKKKLGLINKRADEGDWSDWQDKLPSQFLSKQPLSLAKKQLGIAIKDKQDEFKEICSLNNPTVKKRLLQSFADDCDSAAVHLYAAALPRQKYNVILPLTTIKDNEVYAPNFRDGEKVALIRYPHGGTFEIPELTVNNKHAGARKILGSNATDAVGINSKVAERLSGADFDGDTVMVIPTNRNVRIKSTPQLKDLEGFDPKMSYGTIKKNGKYYAANGKQIKTMTEKNKQNEMGRISNLITDMTLKGATEKELAKAVKHSMVVIDSEKHKLDYKQSYVDNGIESLKKKYQEGGASTLISRAKSETNVPKRQGTPKINIKGKSWYDPDRPEGALIYKTADNLTYEVTKVNKKTGKTTTITKTKTERSTKMAEADDARTLISKTKTKMEQAYADYANSMKALANQSRKELVSTGKIAYSASANKAYDKEVKSLQEKLHISQKNAPRERQALTVANSIIKAKKQDNPDMTKSELKKISQQALNTAREKVGASRKTITISDKEWKAIQAGAISENKLSQILNNTDIDVVRERATPRSTTSLSSSKVTRIKNLKANGLTNRQIADALGISTSTVSEYTTKGNK